MSMRTPESDRPTTRVNLLAVAFLVVVGVVMAAVAVMNDSLPLAGGFLAITWGFAAFLWFGSRHSDTIALLGDDVNEERHAYIHQRAAIYTLNLLAFVVVAGMIVDFARGGDGDPWALMGFIGGVTYTAILLILSRTN